jgi:hypothetical protein
MEEIKIYFQYDTELSEFEAIQKGYRVDVFVKVGGIYFNLKVFDIIRLQQEFKSEVDSEGYYAVEPNLILVKEVNKKEILCTIRNLYKQKYFEEIKPTSNINVDELIEIQ